MKPSTFLKQSLFALVLAGSVGTGHAKSSLAETQRVWERHIDAWKRANVSDIYADYSDDSMIIVNGTKRYYGKAGAIMLFKQLFPLFARAEKHTISPALIQPGLVYITWSARIDGRNHPYGTDTFVVENNQIVYQTITSDDLIFQQLN